MITQGRVYASLNDDLSQGFVWLKKEGLPTRCVAKITNQETKQCVFVEALQIDDNFLRHYNQEPRFHINSAESSIVMSRWYRARLGNLATQHEYALNIANANNYWGKIRACMHHPQIVVRVAVWLSLLSVALGILGFIGSVWPRSGAH